MWFVRGLGRTFLLVGFTMLLFVAYELVGTSAVTNGRQRVLAQQFDVTLRSAPTVTTSPTAKPKVSPRPKPRTPLGRLVIPKIGLRVIVVEGTTLADLTYGPGHYRNTPLPWEPGASGIAGHRTGWSQPFFGLDELQAGDVFSLQTVRGTFRYVVKKKVVVDADDGWVLAGNPDSDAEYQLVLTTCTPKYTSLRRLVVFADRVTAGS